MYTATFILSAGVILTTLPLNAALVTLDFATVTSTTTGAIGDWTVAATGFDTISSDTSRLIHLLELVQPLLVPLIHG